ncbi:MAG: hypothetical protein SFW35_00825 [Chitinophagales bacterium]|nr:hypothetical protein [Chitinophagales bacterium]
MVRKTLPTVTQLRQAVETFKTMHQEPISLLPLDISDMLVIINRSLPRRHKLQISTWLNYLNRDLTAKELPLNPVLMDFEEFIHLQLIEMKKLLMDNIKDGDAKWQRYTWLLERRFNEWSRNPQRKTGNPKPTYSKIKYKAV